MKAINDRIEKRIAAKRSGVNPSGFEQFHAYSLHVAPAIKKPGFDRASKPE
ncbi:MAG TPA: hypothetical protein VMV04_18965 [Thermodesulfobacteriota bacterium]|nr:hypothetical protein [Thermodesulfobacteriota bacterium]